MRKLLLRWAINAAAIWVAMSVIDGIRVDGGWPLFFVVALILGLVNAFIAPVIKVLTCLLNLLTLGLFTLVINAAMLWLTSVIASSMDIGFYVDGFGAAFLGALVISVVSFVLSLFTGVNRKGRHRDQD